jgi:hypothetical protein
MTEKLLSLDLIQIATPCQVSWDDMAGDDRVRFCSHCRLNVYNLSEMPRAAAERLVQEREGRLCVRFYRRHDGTVLTRDCPVGIRALRQRVVRSACALAGLLIAMFSATAFGSRLTRMLPSGFRSPASAIYNWTTPRPAYPEFVGDVVMGGCPPPMPNPVPAPPVLVPAAPGE